MTIHCCSINIINHCLHYLVVKLGQAYPYSKFSHDFTKIQTKKLSIRLSFDFH